VGNIRASALFAKEQTGKRDTYLYFHLNGIYITVVRCPATFWTKAIATQ